MIRLHFNEFETRETKDVVTDKYRTSILYVWLGELAGC